MKGIITSKLGSIEISPEIIAIYAGTNAVECFGIVGMAKVSMEDGGWARLLKRESLTKGIQVTIDDDNQVNLDFHIIVAYGVSIQAVSDNLIENVRYKLLEYTGMKVKIIRIFVEGVREID